MKFFNFTFFLIVQLYSISLYSEDNCDENLEINKKTAKQAYHHQYNKKYYQKYSEIKKIRYEMLKRNCIEQQVEILKLCRINKANILEKFQEHKEEPDNTLMNCCSTGDDDLEIAKILNAIFAKQAYHHQYNKQYYQENRERLLKKSKTKYEMLKSNCMEQQVETLKSNSK